MEFGQFFWGTVLLLISGVIHIVILFAWVKALGPVYHYVSGLLFHTRAIAIICLTFLALLTSHSIQVWLWAYTLYLRDAFSNMNDSLYYSLTSYTTVGYGDLVADENHRILGAMASVAGMLNFGLSTAYLVALLQYTLSNNETVRARILPWQDDPDNS